MIKGIVATSYSAGDKFYIDLILSRIQWKFLRGIVGKNYFRRIFKKFSRKPPKPVKFRPTFWNFYFAFVLHWKKFTKVLSYVVCTKVRRHVYKRITKRRNEEKKQGRFVFGKLVLFTLGLGLTTPYSLGVLVWNLYQMFVTVSLEFWLRFESQIRLTWLTISFLFITAIRKVRSCVKLFDFFRGWMLIHLTWNLSHFVPNSVDILPWNFRKKLFRENFSEIFAQTKAIHYRNLSNFTLLSSIFILHQYCAEKIHTSTFICCLHLGKEALP